MKWTFRWSSHRTIMRIESSEAPSVDSRLLPPLPLLLLPRQFAFARELKWVTEESNQIELSCTYMKLRPMDRIVNLFVSRWEQRYIYLASDLPGVRDCAIFLQRLSAFVVFLAPLSRSETIVYTHFIPPIFSVVESLPRGRMSQARELR